MFENAVVSCVEPPPVSPPVGGGVVEFPRGLVLVQAVRVSAVINTTIDE